jgi:hypothetical protein
MRRKRRKRKNFPKLGDAKSAGPPFPKEDGPIVLMLVAK